VPESCSALMSALLREEDFLPELAGGGLLADAGGGAAAPLAEEGGCVLEGEAVVVFSRTGGTKGSDRPACSEPATVLPAPVSSISGGEEKSSSARLCFHLGAALPELVVPPRGEE
jgi:hypothetical protein